MNVGARLLTVVCVVCLFTLPFRSAAATDVTVAFDVESGAYGTEVRIDPRSFYYPRLAIDMGDASPRRGTIYVLGLNSITCAEIVMSMSSDGGRTFSSPTASSGLCVRGPSLDVVVAADGSLYVATWGPQILRSNDAGLSWELVATLGTATVQGILAIDPDGTLFVASSYRSWGSPGAGPVMVSSSRDGGGNWSAPKSVLPQGISGSSAQIAATSSRVVVSYVGDYSGGRYVAVVTSTDGGTSWSAEAPLSSSFPCARGSAPSLAASAAGTFGVSWHFEPRTPLGGCWDTWGNETEVHVATFSDPLQPTLSRIGGPAWLTDTIGDAIAFDNRSQPYVTWHSIAPGWSSASVYVASGGRVGSLSTTLKVSGGNSTQQENLAAGPGGSMWLVWTVVNSFDPTDPAIGIYVRQVAGGASIEVTGVEAVSPITVELAHPSSGSWKSSWEGEPLQFPDLPAGMYELRVREGNASASADSVPVDPFGNTRITVQIGKNSVPFPWAAFSVLVAVVVGAGIGGLVWLRQRRSSRGRVNRGRK